MADPILRAKGIVKSYGRQNVLRKLDLSIQRGERYVLFGSNGAGKTTLVKILSTVMRPDGGELRIFGKKVGDSRRRLRARIGFMSHEPYLYRDLTAMENLDFYGRLYSISDREERVKAILREVGLFHRAHDMAYSFSRGMLQRLALARALLHDPELVFLDEPYSGLDLRAQQKLNELITKMNERGKTFFFITHDVGKGFGIATRHGVLSKGKIVLETEGGSREEFEKEYAGIIGGER